MKRLIYIYAAMVLLGWQSSYCGGPEAPQKPAHRATAATRFPSSSAFSGSLSLTEAAASPDIYVLEDQDLFNHPEPLDESSENVKDPAYKIYKEGYKYILDGGWVLARNKFSAVLSNYPKSEYVDDASYWSAYALKHIDKKKAVAAYKEFLAKFPNSSYYDDAVADLSQLSMKHHSVGAASGSYSIFSTDDDSSYGNAVQVYTSKKDQARAELFRAGKGRSSGYGYDVTPRLDGSMRKLNQSLRKLELTTPRALTMPRMPAPARAPRALWGGNLWLTSDDTLDEKTKIKMDALYAIGDTKEDSVSYKTLRDVALDPKQPRELRMTALDALSEFKKFDVLPAFIQIATTDKDEEIQNSAINYISDLSGNKDRRVDALIKLFNMLPADKKNQQETIFYTIADIGNDKAVDFLISVAKASPNNELRRQAIYYLGNIGGEKARAALYDVLKEN
jgi:hypothetical protein